MPQSRFLTMVVVMLAGDLQAQGANNPYHASDGWENLPSGMVFGALSGGFPDPRWRAPLDVEQVWRRHMR